MVNTQTKRMLILVAVLSIMGGRWSHARVVADWDYDKLVSESDLVVIGTFQSTEPVEFDFSRSHWATVLRDPVFGPKLRMVLIAEVTTFRIDATLKGPKADRMLNVFHYSFKYEPDVIDNRSRLFKEGLAETDGKVGNLKYLLFLRRRSDDMWEPATGQSDSAYSVKQISSLVDQR